MISVETAEEENRDSFQPNKVAIVKVKSPEDTQNYIVN